MDRKGMKVAAKKAQRKHYWMIVAICLFASVFGVAYTSSTLSVSTNISISTPQTEDSTQSNDMYDVLQDLAVGNENDAREKVKQNQEQIVNNDTDATFGRRRGVIASLLNSFASGSMVIAVADAIKPESPQAVRELQNMGIRVVMLTGDNQRTAEAIGRQAGVDQVIAGVLPDGKEREIRRLSARGKVAMVGDGINDAPALTRADIGIAIGAGTDVAIDAADVVLVNSHLSDVPAAIRLSRATLRNIHENLFWAFFYNTIGIPIAAGVFVPLGLTLNPMIGAAAMSLSSFCVVTNALRLNLFKLRDTRHDHKRANHLKEVPEIKEETAMKKTIQIEGMMCAHCEATVKKALEALPEVTEAEVSHTAGTAVVTLSTPVDDAVLKSTVEAKDYKVTGIA